MENIIAENVSLREIINNINTDIYDINNYNNIRITSVNKPNFVVLFIEADASDDMVQFFENKQFEKIDKNKIVFEKSFNDFVVLSLDNNGDAISTSIISLFELILSSDIIQLEPNELWNLDSTDFNCIEIDYIENPEKEIPTDMNIMG